MTEPTARTDAPVDVSLSDDTTPHERWLGAQYAVVLTTCSNMSTHLGRGDWPQAHEAINRTRAAIDVLTRMVDELRRDPASASRVRPEAVFEIARRVAGTDPLVAAAIGSPR